MLELRSGGCCRSAKPSPIEEGESTPWERTAPATMAVKIVIDTVAKMLLLPSSSFVVKVSTMLSLLLFLPGAVAFAREPFVPFVPFSLSGTPSTFVLALKRFNLREETAGLKGEEL